MGDRNRADGKACYDNSCDSTRAWFRRQWAIWPERESPMRTTSISFLYGGVLAFREIEGRDPALSRDFASFVERLDRYGASNGR